MNNHGNVIGSLGALARWLGARAEALGVEIYPGFAAVEVLYGDKGEVVGVATGDMGVGRDGAPKPSFTRGMALQRQIRAARRGRARLAQPSRLIARFGLDRGPRAAEIRHWPQGRSGRSSRALPARAGRSTHSAGRSARGAGGGSFLYHYDDRLVSVGFVVHLDYTNPYPVAVRRVPALQDPSADPRRLHGRQAHRLWRAGAHRRRLAVGPEARLPRRRADRLRGRLRERAAHQGLA